MDRKSHNPGDPPPPSAIASVMHDDAADLAAAKAGDHGAFARMYDRHAGVVLSLCRQRGLPGEAEDAAQETFIRAFRMLDQVQHAGKLRPFLYGIARHVSSERRRAALRRKRHEDRAMTQTATLPALPIGAAEHTEQAEMLQRLGTALSDLPERERLAVHLYYLDPNAITAAREALGLSRSGYYKLLARAREQLASMLGEVQAQ